MVKNITGTSNVTEYQLVKFSKANLVYQDEILSLYIKYALEFNVQVDVAYVMCLLYTDFFKNEIVGNNIVGIGVQYGGTEMEEFDSVEDCIIAHYEILQKISSKSVLEKPHSNLYRRLENDICVSSPDAFNLFEYGVLTNYNVYDLSIFIREINRTRRENVDWNSSSYYYVQVRSSKNKQELVRLRSELINKKIDAKLISIISNDGIYTLEVGRCSTPILANIIRQNLQVYGYNGEIKYKQTNT